jgi:hypothetical protein
MVIGLWTEVLNIWFPIGAVVGGALMAAEYKYNKYLYLKEQEEKDKIHREYMRLKQHGYLPLVENYDLTTEEELYNVIKRIIGGNASTLHEGDYNLYISMDLLLATGVELGDPYLNYKVKTSHTMEDGYIAFIPK